MLEGVFYLEIQNRFGMLLTKHKDTLSINSIIVPESDNPDILLNFLNKVRLIVNDFKIDDNVFNGMRQIMAPNENLMTPENVIFAINSQTTINITFRLEIITRSNDCL